MQHLLFYTSMLSEKKVSFPGSRNLYGISHKWYQTQERHQFVMLIFMQETVFYFREMWEVKQRARQFLENRPKTSLFLGITVFFGSLPITIFTSIIIGGSIFLGTVFLLLQGTVIVFSLAALATTLAGPLCLAASVTLAFYVLRSTYLGLRTLVLRTTVIPIQLFKRLTGKRNDQPPEKTTTRTGDDKDENYVCEFCRANLHEHCVSRKSKRHKSRKTAGRL